MRSFGMKASEFFFLRFMLIHPLHSLVEILLSFLFVPQLGMSHGKKELVPGIGALKIDGLTEFPECTLPVGGAIECGTEGIAINAAFLGRDFLRSCQR